MVCGMLAMTVQCLLNCRVRSESEAQKHMRRRRKRKREKISKSQAAADSAEPDSQAADDEAGGKDEDDETLTAADELAPMQVCVHLLSSKHMLHRLSLLAKLDRGNSAKAGCK